MRPYEISNLEKGPKSQRKFLAKVKRILPRVMSVSICLYTRELLPLYADIRPLLAEKSLYLRVLILVVFCFTREIDLLLKVDLKKTLEKPKKILES